MSVEKATDYNSLLKSILEQFLENSRKLWKGTLHSFFTGEWDIFAFGLLYLFGMNVIFIPCIIIARFFTSLYILSLHFTDELYRRFVDVIMKSENFVRLLKNIFFIHEYNFEKTKRYLRDCGKECEFFLNKESFDIIFELHSDFYQSSVDLICSSWKDCTNAIKALDDEDATAYWPKAQKILYHALKTITSTGAIVSYGLLVGTSIQITLLAMRCTYYGVSFFYNNERIQDEITGLKERSKRLYLMLEHLYQLGKDSFLHIKKDIRDCSNILAKKRNHEEKNRNYFTLMAIYFLTWCCAHTLIPLAVMRDWLVYTKVVKRQSRTSHFKEILSMLYDYNFIAGRAIEFNASAEHIETFQTYSTLQNATPLELVSAALITNNNTAVVLASGLQYVDYAQQALNTPQYPDQILLNLNENWPSQYAPSRKEINAYFQTAAGAALLCTFASGEWASFGLTLCFVNGFSGRYIYDKPLLNVSQYYEQHISRFSPKIKKVLIGYSWIYALPLVTYSVVSIARAHGPLASVTNLNHNMHWIASSLLYYGMDRYYSHYEVNPDDQKKKSNKDLSILTTSLFLRGVAGYGYAYAGQSVMDFYYEPITRASDTKVLQKKAAIASMGFIAITAYHVIYTYVYPKTLSSSFSPTLDYMMQLFCYLVLINGANLLGLWALYQKKYWQTAEGTALYNTLPRDQGFFPFISNAFLQIVTPVTAFLMDSETTESINEPFSDLSLSKIGSWAEDVFAQPIYKDTIKDFYKALSLFKIENDMIKSKMQSWIPNEVQKRFSFFSDKGLKLLAVTDTFLFSHFGISPSSIHTLANWSMIKAKQGVIRAKIVYNQNTYAFKLLSFVLLISFLIAHPKNQIRSLAGSTSLFLIAFGGHYVAQNLPFFLSANKEKYAAISYRIYTAITIGLTISLMSAIFGINQNMGMLSSANLAQFLSGLMAAIFIIHHVRPQPARDLTTPVTEQASQTLLNPALSLLSSAVSIKPTITSDIAPDIASKIISQVLRKKIPALTFGKKPQEPIKKRYVPGFHFPNR